MKKIILLTACILALTLLGCKKQYQRTAIDDEADKQGKIYWESAVTKCGDFYYGMYAPKGELNSSSPMIYAVKDPWFLTYHKMNDKVFTEADRLNQFEWQGSTSVSVKAVRYYAEGKWHDWTDGSMLLGLLAFVDMRKIHGKWEFGNEGSDKLVAISCEQVPQG